MVAFREIKVEGYERIVEARDEASGLHAIIALHNTTLGPAVGGIRAYPYETFDAALKDVLRLSRGMTYKSAVSETGTSGGKSVIITKKNQKLSEELLLAFAEAVNKFEGNYICAEDIGMSVSNLAIIRQGTRYAVGLPHPKSSGDPCPFTARGGYHGIRAVCKKLWGSDSVAGKTIALQGLGGVGMKLAGYLFWEGAHLIATDVDEEKCRLAARNFGAEIVPIDQIHTVECDILAPCALGGTLNEETIPQLKCKAVAGLANNQLGNEADGKALCARGILYAPDYVINSAGLLNVCEEIDENGYSPERARDKIARIYDLLLTIFTLAEERKQATDVVADELAEYNLEKGIGKREKPVIFHH